MIPVEFRSPEMNGLQIALLVHQTTIIGLLEIFSSTYVKCQQILIVDILKQYNISDLSTERTGAVVNFVFSFIVFYVVWNPNIF